MFHSLNLDRRNRRSFNRRKQGPSQRIADCCAKTTLERLRRKTTIALGESFRVSGQTTRHLKSGPKIILIHSHTFSVPVRNAQARDCRLQTASAGIKLLAIKLDDKLLVDRAVDVVTRRQSADADAHVCAILRNPGRTS